MTPTGRLHSCIGAGPLSKDGEPSSQRRDAELLAFEAGCKDYCEREVDEVEWQGGRVHLHLGARLEAKGEDPGAASCDQAQQGSGEERAAHGADQAGENPPAAATGSRQAASPPA
jgi:hypothetical protein